MHTKPWSRRLEALSFLKASDDPAMTLIHPKKSGVAAIGRHSTGVLTADTQPCNQVLVALVFLALDIIQKPAALRDHFQKATP